MRWLLLCILINWVPDACLGQGKAWQFEQHPEKTGVDTQQLALLRRYITDSTSMTGFMVIQHGKVVFSWGDIEENSYIASCRKSVLAMLYGAYVKSGQINLHTSLKELAVSDVGGLSPQEQEATIGDLLAARSGVYHPASYPGDYLDQAPKRGTVKHGAYWLYSNWDFNVAGYLFERLTHQNIYDAVEQRLAIPLEMQDWNRSIQHKEGDSTKSAYLAYPMWFSTRDMARIGLLMLNKGRYNNKQVIDSAWVNEMVKPRTSYEEVNHNVNTFRGMDYFLGYGYLWWIWQNMPDKRFAGAYSALGAMGQSISVFPVEDAVVVYKTKAAYGRSNTLLQRFRVLTLAIQSFR